MLRVLPLFCVLASLLVIPITGLSQPGSTPAPAYFVHDKIASSDQALDREFGHSIALSGDVLVAGDKEEHVEIFRKAGDGSWPLETVLSAPTSNTEFGRWESIATNGDWIAVGARLDDTYGLDAGAVHMYKFDGVDWEYRGALSHMAPYGSIVTDRFGMAVAMDGNRMVVGSRAENGVGAAGAVHYFEYNAWLDMWLESGFIGSTQTTGNSTSKFAESVDVSGDYMIVGEHRNNTNGTFAGAAHIYAFYNQCWHHATTFYGQAAGDILGKDVAISGTNAVAGAPYADTDGLNEAGAAALYQLLPQSGGGEAWTETFYFASSAPVQGDWFGSAVDIDGDLLLIGAPRDDEYLINGGIGYFLFDCSTNNFDCVAEGTACDAEQNDRMGFDVAVSGGIGAIGSVWDDNIFEDAGSVYILGSDDIGFACDVTSPGAPETDLVDEDDTGLSAEDDTTRQTTPDFDVFLPGGGSLSVTSDYTAQAGDALVFYMEGSGDSTLVILTEDDIDNGVVHFEFVYPGPVLEDGTYTFCSYLIDVFGNVGETDCQTILIDNSDPIPTTDFGTSAVAGSDTTLYLDDNGDITLDISNVSNISASDNHGMDTLYVDITDFDCADAGSIVTVTLTAVDIAGNIATTTFDVAIQDDEAPDAIAQNLTVQLDATGAGSITAAQVDNGSTDNCSIASTTLDISSFGCADVGDNTVILTVTDASGNSSTASATVTVQDNVSPVAIAQNLTVQLDATGAGSITAAQVDNGSSDACGIASMTLDNTDFGCADVGDNTVTLTVTDNNGNVSTATATITVEDNVSPAMATQDVTVTLDDSGNGSITVGQVDDGTSDACGLDTLYLDVYDFDCDDLGANSVTLTALDANGNMNTATATVTVQELTDPTAIAQDITVQLDGTGNASITAAQVDNGSYDLCSGIASMSVTPSSFTCADLGDNTVTLTVNDASGNSATATATVTVEDNINPTLSGTPADMTQNNDAGICGAAVNWTDPATDDNCSATLSSTHNSGDTFAVGTTTVTFTATDLSGNTATSTFTITVNDNEDPSISGMPSDITLSNDAGTCGAMATWTEPTAADNCGVASFTSSHSSGATFGVGTTTVTYTATDIHSNTTTATFTVTVTDDEDPSISGTPSNISLSNDAGNCSAVATWTEPTASDNCGLDDLSSSHTSGTTFSVGTTTVTYTAEDIHGNTTTSTFTVTVTDDEAPTIAGMPSDTTLSSDAGLCTAVVTWAAPTASDNCGVASLTADANSGDAFSIGANTVTYTATDIHGNVTTASFTITVEENEDPTISGMPASITLTNDAGMCSAVATWTEPSAADNCGIASFTPTHASGSTFPVGTTTVVYTATDDAGNTASASFTVTVTDDEAPSIGGTSSNISLSTDAGTCGAVATWTGETAADNCGIASLTSTPISGTTFPVGTTPVTYTATDIHGNTTTSTFTVTVTDDEAPAISGMPSNITLSNDAGSCGAVATWTAPTASDNCGSASLTPSHASGATFTVGTTTVTYTATDDYGNTSSASFTVTVTDDEAPAIAGTPSNIALSNDAGDCGAVATWSDPTASDNCGVASLTSTHNSGATFGLGTTAVTYTATDIHGNTTTSTFTVTVTDDEDPSISGMPSDIALSNDAGICGAVATWATPTASDNCGIASFTSTHSSGMTYGVGTTMVTYTATDVNGNTTTATFTVTVTDDESPVISGMPSNISLSNDAGVCGAVATWTEPSDSDNCGIDSFTSTHNSGDTFTVGTTTVTYTATDDYGNTSTASFTVTVTDNEAPVISGMPANITQSNDAGECEAEVTWTAPTESDNCGIASFSADAADGDTFPVGTTTVTYTATDIHGNSTTASFTITITDDEAPSIAGSPADITQSNDAGMCSATVTWADPTASDNCGVASFTTTHDSGSSFTVGTTSVTYTATDIHGNTTTSTFTVTVNDDEAPVINPMAADTTYERDGGEAAAFAAWLAAYGGASATDNCGLSGWSNNSSGLSDDCGSVGTETVTFTATDIHGNSSTTTATFTVTDSFAPSCPLIDLTDGSDTGLDSTDNLTNDDTPTMHVVFTGSGPESAEAGDIVELYIMGVLSQTHTVTETDVANGYASFETGPFADGPVMFSAKHLDGCGQASIFAFLNIIVHSTDPTASADGLTLNLDPSGNVLLEAEDIDDGSGDDFNVVDLTVSQTSFDCADLGDNEVTLTVTDIAGNTATATATVTVIDDEAPTITPMDITVQLDASGAAAITAADVASVSDNCTVSSTTIDITSFDCSDVGEVTVTISATDQSGNSSTATATVTVEDSIAPEVTLIAGDAEEEEGDNEGGAAEVTFTFTLDNYGSDEAFVDIYDSEGTPVVSYPIGYFPSNATVEETLSLAPGTYTIVLGDDWGDGWAWFPATGEDAVVISGGATGSLDFVNGGLISLEFTVEDAGIPESMGGITVELGPDGTVSIEPGDVLVSATDNCGLGGMTLDISTFDCSHLGNNTVTLTATDVNGNSTSASTNVYVEDNEVPVVNIFDLEDYTMYAGETCVNTVDLFAAGQPWYEATDNCGQDVEIVYDVVNETGIAGCREFDRRWIIHSTDASGNMGSDTTFQHITVIDTTAPTVFFDNAPEDMTLELDANCSVEIPEPAGGPAGPADVTFTFTTDNYGLEEAAATIYDADGNAVASYGLGYFPDNATVVEILSLDPGVYTIELYDDWGDGWAWSPVTGVDAVVISGGATGSLDFLDGSLASLEFTVTGEPSEDAISASATDNCSDAPSVSAITITDGAPEYLCEGGGSYTVTRTFTATATDDCGNETVATYAQVFTVLDVTAPQITDSEGILNGETLTQEEAGGVFDFISLPDAVELDAEDGCSSVNIEMTETIDGYVPTEEIGNYCAASTPEAFLNGNACSGNAPAAIVLEGAPFNGEAFNIVPGGINIIESHYDQSLSIEIEVENADGTGGFIWNADYNAALSWAQWDALGRGYKKDCADVLPGTSPWTQWKYLIMQTGGMLGTGIYAGSELSLTHQPMNYYYGLQIGNGANNQNANYGASAWFYWSGELIVDGESQGDLGSSGDINIDLACTLPWTASFDYAVSDACGNTASFGYTVTNAEAQGQGATVSGEGSGHQPFDVSVGADIKEPIRVTGLMPNPTNNVSQLGFVVSNNMRLRVDLYDMSGQLIEELFDGNAMSDVEYFLTIDAQGLDAGMYQIRISSNAYMAVKKLLVSH